MEGDSTEIPAGAMEDIAYLGRSANRLCLLRALAGEPATRSALVERTGIASTTIGRILNELEDRRWVERTSDGEYEASPTGRIVVREFEPLVDAMHTIGRLDEAVELLPLAELSIEISAFSDARVVEPSPNAPFELVERMAELIQDATVFRVLTFLDPPQPVGEAMEDGVLGGRLTAEAVLAGGLVEFLRTRGKQPPRWRQFIEAGASVYRYGGHIPCNLFLMDETVLIMSDQPKGGGAAIESENETVRRAVMELYEDYLEAADPIEADYFASQTD